MHNANLKSVHITGIAQVCPDSYSRQYLPLRHGQHAMKENRSHPFQDSGEYGTSVPKEVQKRQTGTYVLLYSRRELSESTFYLGFKSSSPRRRPASTTTV